MSNGNRRQPEYSAVDDEALSALIDGELSADAASALQRRLADEPALARRYAALRGVDDTVRQAVDDLDDSEIPERVLELLREPAAGSGHDGDEPRRGVVIPLRRMQRAFQMPVAIAAGLALVVGILVGQQLRGPATDAPLSAFVAMEHIDTASPLGRLLHELPSNESVELADGIAVTPRMSFARAGGGHCRLVEIAGGDAMARSVACHSDGAWRMEMAEFAPTVDAADASGWRPATAPDGPLERALDALIDGAPLGRDEERALMQRGWRD